MRSSKREDGSAPCIVQWDCAQVPVPEKRWKTRGGVPSAASVVVVLAVWIFAGVLTPACELVPDCVPVWLGPGLPGDPPHTAV